MVSTTTNLAGLPSNDVQEQLAALQNRCQAPGGGAAVMQALYICALHCVPLPDWLRSHFVRRAGLVQRAELGSWDDAFGRPWPRGAKKLMQARQGLAMRSRIYARVWELVIDKHRPLNAALFDQLGPEFERSGSTIERLYYQEIHAGRPSVATVKRSLA